MRYLKQKYFGEVQAFELGWSPMGRPAMTVHFYIKEMGLKENYLLKAFCMGNLSMKNMVRSAYVSLNPKVD